MVAPSWGTFQTPSTVNKSMLAEENPIDLPLAKETEQIESQAERPTPQWGNFQSPETYQGPEDPTTDESGLDYIVRNASSYASRLAEQFVGSRGNIEKFSKDILANFPASGGIVGWALSELMGPEKWENLVRGSMKQQVLPTSEELKKISYEATKGYTKPKTKGEARVHEFTEDVGAMLSGKARPELINTLLIPAAANTAKGIVEYAGFGEDKGTLAKLAVWTPLMLSRNVNGPQFASNLMNEGRRGFAATLQANVPRLLARINNISNSPLLLHSDPRNALAREAISDLKRDIRNGQTNMQSLLTMYDGINASKRSRGLFEFNSTDRNYARRAINEVLSAVREEIHDVGASNPQALQNWQNGVNAWATIHQSNAIRNWVEGLAKGPYAKMLAGPALSLFGIGTYGAIKAPIIAGPLGAVTAGAYKTAQIIYRMWNNPDLANYYWRAISAAVAENAPAFISNYNKFNKKFEKSESVEVKKKSNIKQSKHK